MTIQRFDYYFMKRNGLWQERLDEYKELGSGGASSIAVLIHACEIGDGIDQHASENLKAVSSFIAAQADELIANAAELATQETRLNEKVKEISFLSAELARLQQERDEFREMLAMGYGWKEWALSGGGFRDAFMGWLKDIDAALERKP